MIQLCVKVAKMNYRGILLFLISVVLTFAGCTPDVVVTLTTDHETYSPYQQIYCTLKVKNCGSDTITYICPIDENCCGYSIVYPDGEKYMSGGYAFGGDKYITLAPGDSNESDAMLWIWHSAEIEKGGFLFGSHRRPGRPDVVARLPVYRAKGRRRDDFLGNIEARKTIIILPANEQEQKVVDTLIHLYEQEGAEYCTDMLNVLKSNSSIPSQRALFESLCIHAWVMQSSSSLISWEFAMAYPDYPRLRENLLRLKPDSTFLREVRANKRGTRLYELLMKKGWLK